MKEQLEKLAHESFVNPFNQETDLENWNQFDIAVADFQNAVQTMRNLLCDCTVKPRRSKEELDNMVKKIEEANS